MTAHLKSLGRAVALAAIALAAPGPAAALTDPVQFDTPIVIEQAPILHGDAGDTRCPDPSQPCLKGVSDLLYGRAQVLRGDDLVLTSNTVLTLAQTQNSAVAHTEPRDYSGGSPLARAPVAVGARLFESASDTVVTLYPVNQILYWRLEDLSGTRATGNLSVGNYEQVHTAVTDLTGDGLDEIVIWLSNAAESIPSLGLIATAVDPHDPAKGLRIVSTQASPGIPMGIAVAVAAGQPRVLLAQHPDQSAGCGYSGFSGLEIDSYTVDPKTLALNPAGSFVPTLPEGPAPVPCVATVDIAAGRLSTAAHDQFAIVYGVLDHTIKVIPFDLDAQGNPVQKPYFDTTYPTGNVGGHSNLTIDRFDWASPVDQVALMVSNCFDCPGINSLRILRFGADLSVTSGPVFQPPDSSRACAGDLVAGNFDRQKTNPQAPPATLADANLQLAVEFSDCGNNVDLRILDVDPGNGFAISQHSRLALVPGGSVFGGSMAAADLQGRSLRVGPPAIVTIDKRQQATLVLAAPPMHVDALEPISGGNLRPFNITGAPDGFFAGFSFSTASDSKSDTTSDLTWSFSAKETSDNKVTAGDCEFDDCASVGFKASAQQALDGSKASMSGRYSSVAQSLNVTTGFTDIVSYKQEALTIYIYTALGRTVCPSDKPGCSDAEKVPLTVNVAGPDTITYREAQPGSALTWYQPVWIPGNLLSYPGNTQQLQAAAFADPTDFHELSDPAAWFIGSGGTASKGITWTGGGSSGSSSSFKQNYSFETDMSVSGKAGLEGIVSAEASLEVDLSGSFGFSNLTDSQKSLSATQGIQLTRTASFLADPNYGYEVTPHIFGKQQPTTVVDSNTAPADVQTFGALRTGHEVDLSTGAFWQAWYGNAPDLALNHPARWNIRLAGGDLGDGSCLSFNASTSDYDCMFLGDRLPPGLGEPIWLSAFHWMRGLFITGPTGGGPQFAVATTGDQLLLQARVYNLSMADLDGTEVHVRFMAMPWNSRHNIPAGPSFQIGEQVLGGADLPAYNTDTSQPNWTLAAQPFDTSGTHCGGHSCDNLDLVFWVVVWAQNADGSLVGELPQHGLASAPAAGEDFLAVATREQTYGNNLGLYNQVFHVFPKTPAVRAPTPAAGAVGAAMTLAGSAVRELPRGQSTALAVKVDTGGRDLNAGLEVAFYDGNPKAGGPLIGLQTLPYLAADSQYDFRVPFRSQVCGLHTVHAVAGEGTRHAHTIAFKPIEVLCNDLAKLGAAITAKTGTQGQRIWTLTLSNTGTAAARDAQVTGLKLTQTFGAACTPLITTPTTFPLPVGTIPAGGKASGAVTVNFTGCAANARFRANLGFSSDRGAVTGTTTLYNQFR